MSKTTAAQKELVHEAYEDKYRAEDDLRTLARAAEIKADPKRYKAAVAMAKEQMKSLAEVTMTPKK